MIKSLQILLVGIFMLTPLAFGQLGRLSDFDGALQTKFALEISEVAGENPESFTLSSNALIREYALPGTVRIYWVFDFDGPLIDGGLVIADRETGKIHEVIAKATQISTHEFIGEGVDSDTAIHQDRGVEAFPAANFALVFEMDGLELSIRSLMKFQFIQVRNFSLLRMSSVAGVAGEGALDDQSPLMVTGGTISAGGTVANLD